MTNGKRNRAAGNGFERELASIFRDLGFPHVVTTRSESRSRDAQKIDLMNKEEGSNGRFPYNIQAKNVTNHLKYGKVLSEMPTVEGVTNVVLHKQTEKNSSGRFICTGRYAILHMEDFFKIVTKLKEYEEMIGNTEIVETVRYSDLEDEEEDDNIGNYSDDEY